MSKKVVMNDVARAAGVSIQTVSRVLNEHPAVSPTTRASVLAAVEALGYRPNLAARSLAAGSSKTVGVLLLTTVGHGSAAAFAEIVESARQSGYHLVLTTAESSSRESLRRAMDEMEGHRVSAVIVLARRADVVKELASLSSTMPRVLLAGSTGSNGSFTVSVDHVAGARKVTRHLVDTGRTRLVHITGDLEYVDAILRRDAFLETADELGVEAHVVDGGGWSTEDGRRAAEEALGYSPDAIFAFNDELALGALRTLHDMQVDVPREIAVAGFDDSPMSRCLVPSLTSVVQDFRALGRSAMDLALAAATGGDPTDVLIPVRLVIRESTRSAR